MDYFQKGVQAAAAWTRGHLQPISFALITSLLSLYGETINQALKKQIKSWPFVLRTLLFVLVCGIGYGMMVVAVSPYLCRFLMVLNDFFLLALVFCAFLGLGLLAEHKRRI